MTYCEMIKINLKRGVLTDLPLKRMHNFFPKKIIERKISKYSFMTGRYISCDSVT